MTSELTDELRALAHEEDNEPEEQDMPVSRSDTLEHSSVSREIPWLKDGTICNDGLCIRMEDLIKQGKSVREASKLMAEEATSVYPELHKEFNANVIRNRYKRKMLTGRNDPHTNVNNQQPGRNDPVNNPEGWPQANVNNPEGCTNMHVNNQQPGRNDPVNKRVILGVRVSPEQKTAIKQKAEKRGLSIQDYVIERCL